MNFDFATAGRIIFGPGRAQEIPKLAEELGQRALLLTGSRPDRHRPILEPLLASNRVAAHEGVEGEPDIDAIRRLTKRARTAGCDWVIALGGGSVIDSGKAVAAMLANPGDVLDYLEVVGQGKPLHNPSAPVLAAPTTAGTGAEVTRNAVLAVPEASVKVSMRSPTMLPRIALIDPTLTFGLPPDITAATGMDALTQCLEPYVSHQANPLSDGLAREGLTRAARALRAACRTPEDPQARAEMAIASLCGGLALANARLGAVHGFAGVLGGMFSAPHGALCARLLPPVFAANVAAVATRGNTRGEPHPLARFDTVAQLLTQDAHAKAADGVAWLETLCADLHIPGLSTYGLTEAKFPEVIDAAARASSMQGNPVTLTQTEMETILRQSL